MTRIAVLARLLPAASLVHLVACTTTDPLYCDEQTPCTDPARPFCDLEGEYPASGGVGRTCIADPAAEDADPDETDGGSGDPDGDPDGGPDGGADGGQPPEPEVRCPGGLAFVSQRDGNDEIHVSAADGSNQVNLTQSPSSESDPSWSPDGTKIAFVRDAAVWSMNADGSGSRQMTTGPGDRLPKWSPDGTRIAFLRRGASTFDLWVADADGGEATRLTITSAVGGFSWSPDGASLVFSAAPEGFGDIFTIAGDGSEQTNRTTSVADDVAPVWSPDGRQILFASGSDGDYDLWIMEANGPSPRNLSNMAESIRESVFTPDGSKIIYVVAAGSGTESHLYSMNADGGDQEQITFAEADVEAPAVSADGARMAWAQTDPVTVLDVYVANPDGTEVVRVTSESGTSPAWQPCR